MKSKKKKHLVPQPYRAIAQFLEKNGWKVVVIGGASVEKRDIATKYNYSFVVNFTGAMTSPTVARSPKPSPRSKNGVKKSPSRK